MPGYIKHSLSAEQIVWCEPLRVLGFYSEPCGVTFRLSCKGIGSISDVLVRDIDFSVQQHWLKGLDTAEGAGGAALSQTQTTLP